MVSHGLTNERGFTLPPLQHVISLAKFDTVHSIYRTKLPPPPTLEVGGGLGGEWGGLGGRGGGVGSYTQKVVHTQGGAYTKRCTHKAVCGHRKSHVIKGATGKAVHTEGGAHTRQNKQKAACGHGRSHVIEGATGKVLHTEGGAQTR